MYGDLGLGIKELDRAAYWENGDMGIFSSTMGDFEGVGDGIIDITKKGSNASTMGHEFVHRDQYASSVHADMDKAFFDRRIAAGPVGDDAYTVQELGSLTGQKYGVDELAIGDEFMSPYMGKLNFRFTNDIGDYTLGQPVEVSSVGWEEIAFGKEYGHIFDVDPDMADYMLGLLLAG